MASLHLAKTDLDSSFTYNPLFCFPAFYNSREFVFDIFVPRNFSYNILD